MLALARHLHRQLAEIERDRGIETLRDSDKSGA
jgi:hypothetical protein